MRAAWYEHNGAAKEVLQTGNVADAEPQAGEVRVKLMASGVNPSDVKSRQARPLIAPRIIPHSDGAGVIDAVGTGVASSRIGERVWIWNGQWKRPLGTAAEKIALPSVQAVFLPDNTDFAAGACLGIPALTAWRALDLLGDIQGKTLLVIGASSAVGNYVTQIATRDKSATVIATTGSDAKAEHARAAGASHTINYKDEDVAAKVLRLTDGRGVDAIIDMDFSSTAAMLATGCLADHGTLICYGSNIADKVTVPFRELLFKSISIRFFLVYELLPQDRKRGCADVNRLLTEGKLTHALGASYALNDIVAAHEAVEHKSGHIGNITLHFA
jgi:NADPH2:quinone reductase